jgi:ABC-type branched-subunit amino acid transport system ATPase component
MRLYVSDMWSGYGDITVLRGVGFSVRAGEMVAVLGRNGVGKTTLMRTRSGAIRSKQGILRLEGEDISDRPAHERARLGIAYVPQGRQIFQQLTVLENLLIGAYAEGMAKAKVHQVVESLLTDFPSLKTKLRAAGGSLSGGQQQLLALARSLVTSPNVLLLDEPSEGIQPSLLDEIADVLLRICARDELSVVLVEQNLDFTRRLAGRGFLMDSGQLKRELDISASSDDEQLHRELFGAEATPGSTVAISS